MASQTVLYLKLDQNVKIRTEEVQLKDLGKLVCSDPQLLARAKTMKIYRFRKEDAGRKVISVMKILETLQKEFPDLTVECLGQTEVIVEQCRERPGSGFWEIGKIAFVCLICFFGTAFTIMAFHNDVGISEVFIRMYEMISGKPSDGFTILEGSYCLGLAIGITVFFNHIGGKRLTQDPTPIEVEMRVYEEEVNKALAETADREGRSADVS